MLNKIAGKLQQQDKDTIQLIQKPNPENNINNDKKKNNQQTKSNRYFLTLTLPFILSILLLWLSPWSLICYTCLVLGFFTVKNSFLYASWKRWISPYLLCLLPCFTIWSDWHCGHRLMFNGWMTTPFWTFFRMTRLISTAWMCLQVMPLYMWSGHKQIHPSSVERTSYSVPLSDGDFVYVIVNPSNLICLCYLLSSLKALIYH